MMFVIVAWFWCGCVVVRRGIEWWIGGWEKSPAAVLCS